MKPLTQETIAKIKDTLKSSKVWTLSTKRKPTFSTTRLNIANHTIKSITYYNPDDSVRLKTIDIKYLRGRATTLTGAEYEAIDMILHQARLIKVTK